MLANKIMQVLKNLFGLNKKISASEIAFKDINNSVFTLDQYLINMGTYSTTEKRIGTWIDGKPIYRKVIIGNLNGTYTENGKTFTWIKIGTTIDRLIKLDLDFDANDEYKYITSTNYDLTVSIRYKNQIQIGVTSNVSNGQEIIFILEYTKTTD